jgi:hypothetical protein
MQRHLQQMPGDTVRWVGATFCKVPAHYPDPGNPGHYMNVFKTPTTLNDGQQQPVDNFAPRANLKFFLKTVPFQSGPAIPAAADINTDSYLVLWTHSASAAINLFTI